MIAFATQKLLKNGCRLNLDSRIITLNIGVLHKFQMGVIADN